MQKGEYDIVCSQLCGWGHYKMKGRLVVESPAAFEKYLAELKARQDAVAPPWAAEQTAETEQAPTQPEQATAAAPATKTNETTSPLANTNLLPNTNP